MWNPNITFRPSSSKRCGINTTCNIPWYNKRKIEPDPTDYELHPSKMLITEEKMVSQLKGIHLSKDFTSHGNAGPSNVEIEMDESLKGINQKSSLPTLVMCDEIRELQKNVQSPLPQHILDNFKRPTNALVLWRPPAGELGKYLMNIRDNLKEDTNKETQQQNISDVDMGEDDDNNNGSSNQNFNGVFARTI